MHKHNDSMSLFFVLPMCPQVFEQHELVFSFMLCSDIKYQNLVKILLYINFDSYQLYCDSPFLNL